MPKELSIVSIVAVLALMIACFGGLRCAQMDADLMRACIEKTDKPLECRAAIKQVR